MIKVSELEMGWNDAENYKRRDEKNLFNMFFTHTSDLDKLCTSNVFFLIGEKGTGKTAYALYISNNGYKKKTSKNISVETKGMLKYIRESGYQKFIELKRNNHLILSNYADIWSVLIYLLLSRQIMNNELRAPDWGKPIERYIKFNAIQKAISEFYEHGFKPEVVTALEFVENAKTTASLGPKYLFGETKVEGENAWKMTKEGYTFQISLSVIQNQFEDAIRGIKSQNNHILFLDGIDVRPDGIPYEEYLECVRGLANAVWTMNNDFFPSIKGSPGRLKVVLLLRPDIFEVLGLQNLNNKLHDNSVLIDWKTDYRSYRECSIFEVADNMLRSQQVSEDIEHFKIGDAWDYYFPYNSRNMHGEDGKPTSFIDFLKNSLNRPRDIITMLRFMQTAFINDKRAGNSFSQKDFLATSFQEKLANYYMGEIHDELLFHYTEEEYNIFSQFFSHLRGSAHFSYSKYLKAFNSYHKSLVTESAKIPPFCTNPDKFLQFLYEHNIICYIDCTSGKKIPKWCFEQRSYGNLTPKVRINNEEYSVHYGMRKAFDLGKPY